MPITASVMAIKKGTKKATVTNRDMVVLNQYRLFAQYLELAKATTKMDIIADSPTERMKGMNPDISSSDPASFVSELERIV